MKGETSDEDDNVAVAGRRVVALPPPGALWACWFARVARFRLLWSRASPFLPRPWFYGRMNSDEDDNVAHTT